MNPQDDFFEHVVLQHRPIYDAQRRLTALDLVVTDGDGTPVAAADWLAALRRHTDEPCALDSDALVLHVRDGDDLLRLAAAPAGAVIAVDADIPRDASCSDAMQVLFENRSRFWCERGAPEPAWPVGQPVWAHTAHSGRALITGVDRMEDLDAAFQRGAAASHGWPLHNPLRPADPKTASDVKLALELMQAVDRGADIGDIESLVQRSPTLTFRLMAFLNTSARGRAPRDASLRHALMMLGMAQLRQWVSLLVSAAAGSAATMPMVHASLWRANFMRAVGAAVGPSMPATDMFVCGAFSLLDQLLGRELRALLGDLQLTDEVQACLVGGDGPLQPYLALARAVEGTQALDMAQAVEATMLTAGEINRAIVQAAGSMLASVLAPP
jgi:hypothetical protein